MHRRGPGDRPGRRILRPPLSPAGIGGAIAAAIREIEVHEADIRPRTMIERAFAAGRPITRSVTLLACVGVLTACEAGDVDLRDAARDAPEGTGVGQRAPALVGEVDADTPWALMPADWEYTAVVFIRGADCGLCRLRLEEIARHQNAYDAANVTVVVASAESPEALREAARSAGATVSSVSVEEPVLRGWDVLAGGGRTLPATYLLDRAGIVRYRHVGRNAGDRANDVEVLAAVGQDRERHRLGR